MDGQVTAGTLVLCNSEEGRCRVAGTMRKWHCAGRWPIRQISLKPGMSPADVHGFECRVEGLVRELARAFEQIVFQFARTAESGSDAAAC